MELISIQTCKVYKPFVTKKLSVNFYDVKANMENVQIVIDKRKADSNVKPYGTAPEALTYKSCLA